jgi:hypothetical protein
MLFSLQGAGRHHSLSEVGAFSVALTSSACQRFHQAMTSGPSGACGLMSEIGR